MQIIHSIQALRDFRKSLPLKKVGFVPTMGHLHQGHLSLIEAANAQSDYVLLSIFVNPAQFNNPSDLANYPRTFEQDLELAEASGVDVVFAPTHEQIYEDGYRYRVHENVYAQELEGQYRPGHFEGVLTVVLKLFHLVEPHITFFGEKDYQQLQLIKDMVKAFMMDIEVVACPTVREASGLAMSSRNSRLSPPQRLKAAQLFHAMQEFNSCEKVREYLEAQGFKVDYIEDKQGRRFGAATLDEVRLIDNIPLS